MNRTKAIQDLLAAFQQMDAPRRERLFVEALKRIPDLDLATLEIEVFGEVLI